MGVRIHFKNSEERYIEELDSLNILDENKTQIIALKDGTTLKIRNRDILYVVEGVSEN